MRSSDTYPTRIHIVIELGERVRVVNAVIGRLGENGNKERNDGILDDLSAVIEHIHRIVRVHDGASADSQMAIHDVARNSNSIKASLLLLLASKLPPNRELFRRTLLETAGNLPDPHLCPKRFAADCGVSRRTLDRWVSDAGVVSTRMLFIAIHVADALDSLRLESATTRSVARQIGIRSRKALETYCHLMTGLYTSHVVKLTHDSVIQLFCASLFRSSSQHGDFIKLKADQFAATTCASSSC
jgi:hypothetical protein